MIRIHRSCLLQRWLTTIDLNLQQKLQKNCYVFDSSNNFYYLATVPVSCVGVAVLRWKVFAENAGKVERSSRTVVQHYSISAATKDGPTWPAPVLLRNGAGQQNQFLWLVSSLTSLVQLIKQSTSRRGCERASVSCKQGTFSLDEGLFYKK